jgi:hypothetical protein
LPVFFQPKASEIMKRLNEKTCVFIMPLDFG